MCASWKLQWFHGNEKYANYYRWILKMENEKCQKYSLKGLILLTLFESQIRPMVHM